MEKVGRNDPCPCGSGKKYKKCHIDKDDTIPPEVSLEFERIKAQQMQIEKQQGLGRSIISNEFKGHRMIAVGNRIHFSPKWQTFHDFLIQYIPITLGEAWGKEELAKPFEERHPVIQWHEMVHKYMKEHQSGDGVINTAPMTGAMSAYMSLSYNLYLLAHNVQVQERLIKRLKDKDQFRGAQYETYVAAEFIKAGFKLAIENEEDVRTTHCEFTAVSEITNRKYSIEAKARQPYKNNVSLGNQLYEALKKEAQYERVIFIDVNIPGFMGRVSDIVSELKRKETSLKIEGRLAGPAYVFVTNHPFEYALESASEHRAGFAHGYKIPGFEFDFRFTNIRDVLKAREQHKDMFHLVKSICEHEEIPSTFDGEAPEFAFAAKGAPPRLIIGKQYVIPGPDGTTTVGILENATVSDTKKEVWGVYRTPAGNKFHCTSPMTDEELIAYKRQPDTFFGVPLHQGGKIKDPLDFFDFLYESYKETRRDLLLEWVKDWPHFDMLKNLSDEELRISYCEGIVYSEIKRGNLIF